MYASQSPYDLLCTQIWPIGLEDRLPLPTMVLTSDSSLENVAHTCRKAELCLFAVDVNKGLKKTETTNTPDVRNVSWGTYHYAPNVFIPDPDQICPGY